MKYDNKYADSQNLWLGYFITPRSSIWPLDLSQYKPRYLHQLYHFVVAWQEIRQAGLQCLLSLLPNLSIEINWRGRLETGLDIDVLPTSYFYSDWVEYFHMTSLSFLPERVLWTLPSLSFRKMRRKSLKITCNCWYVHLAALSSSADSKLVFNFDFCVLVASEDRGHCGLEDAGSVRYSFRLHTESSADKVRERATSCRDKYFIDIFLKEKKFPSLRLGNVKGDSSKEKEYQKLFPSLPPKQNSFTVSPPELPPRKTQW